MQMEVTKVKVICITVIVNLIQKENMGSYQGTPVKGNNPIDRVTGNLLVPFAWKLCEVSSGLVNSLEASRNF